MGGASWSPAGLQGSYLDTIAETRDGHTLLAAGDALYVSRDGVVWLRVDLPVTGAAPVAEPASGGDQHAGHEHGQPAPPNPITALAVGPAQVFAGTSQGLFTSGLDGPLRQLALPAGGVRGLAVDPADPLVLWVASTSGPVVTPDGGRTWSRQVAGLARPASVSAIASVGGEVFVSDTTGVFRWEPAARSWTRTSSQPAVAELSPSPSGGALYASSLDNDLAVLAGGRWTDLGQPAPVHSHHGHVHGQPAAVTQVDARLYAAGTSDGVSASADGGWTWSQLGGGLGATPSWWVALLALATGLGLAAVGVSALDQRRRRAGERGS